MLVHRPYTEADGPNTQRIIPWRYPLTVRSQVFTVRSQVLAVAYRVSRDGELAETPVRLG